MHTNGRAVQVIHVIISLVRSTPEAAAAEPEDPEAEQQVDQQGPQGARNVAHEEGDGDAGHLESKSGSRHASRVNTWHWHSIRLLLDQITPTTLPRK